MIASVFARHPEVTRVRLFGSRAMGTNRPNSDIDIALWGRIDVSLLGQIKLELDELPLPYTFDVVVYSQIKHDALKRHIDDYSRDFH